MNTELIFILIGIADIVLLTCKMRKQERKTYGKCIAVSTVYVLVAAFIMLLSENFIPKMASDEGKVLAGCIAVVIIPLILAVLALLLVNKTYCQKQKSLIVTGALAIVCAVLACILESKNIIETQNYVDGIDFNSAAIMQVGSFEPQFVTVVKILILLPALFVLVISAIPDADISHKS